jgi:hypothetical protein
MLILEPLDWLLEEDNPSVRYFALRDLVGLPPDNNELLKAKSLISSFIPVQKILSHQTEGGWWGKPEEFYTNNKYRGTVWNLIQLAEMGMTVEDERIRNTVEFVLKASQDPSSGGFGYRTPDPDKPDPALNIPCLSGNMIWSMLRAGYPVTEQIKSAIKWLVETPRYIDGETPAPKGETYQGRKNCWGRHTCISGVVKILKALAEIPEEQRSPEVHQAIQDGTEFLLKHHLVRKSHHLEEVSKPKWTKPSFPWLWDTNVVEMLDILTRLGINDPRLQEGFDLIQSKQRKDGKWIQEGGFTDQLLVPFERIGQPSKWVTLFALRIIQRATF